MSRSTLVIALATVMCLGLAATAAAQSDAPAFTVTSVDITDGQPLGMKQVGNYMGCTGENLSPQLEWSNAPEGTKSFAVTIHDADVPSHSGWWHWQIYDIPAKATGLPQGVGAGAEPPTGAQQGKNDAGWPVYGGACPPPGTGVHNYTVRVYALGVDKLPVEANASAAMISVMLEMNALAKAKLTGTYERPAPAE